MSGSNLVTIITGNAGLLEYVATIPIAYEVKTILQPELLDGGLGGIVFHEQPVNPPYIKDYDAEESPLHWAREFDLSDWGVLVAMQESHPLGSATIAYHTPGVRMLAGRNDLAVLWDIRVRPEWRGMGIGKRLFAEAATWAHYKGCRQLKIETQNVNVPACRFYRSRGCWLGEIDRFAYTTVPSVAHEVMLVWYLDLK